jgi:hypothetical protein
MQLLTEVQECISLMDKELNHFVEALLVSAKKLNQTLFHVYVFTLIVCIVPLSHNWKVHSFLNSVWFSPVFKKRFWECILKQCIDFFASPTYLPVLHSFISIQHFAVSRLYTLP